MMCPDVSMSTPLLSTCLPFAVYVLLSFLGKNDVKVLEDKVGHVLFKRHLTQTRIAVDPSGYWGLVKEIW
jgi:hypothetical protein